MIADRPSPSPGKARLPSEFVLGTTNKKKALELEWLLAPLGFRVTTLSDYPDALEVDEAGTTFVENARLKAVQQALHLKKWTIGEDSGLCVPALGGAPGIYSARYSGPDATDASNNELLLERMGPLDESRRTAFYVSTIVLADPEGTVHLESEGRCWGRILREPRGTGGFGYDPLFEIVEYHQTFAELGSQVKSVLSHRARAFETFAAQLRRWPQTLPS